MMQRKILKHIFCLVLIIVLSFQLLAVAGDVVDVVCKGITVVVGAVFVVAGVALATGAAIVGGKPNLFGGAGLADIGVDMIKGTVKDDGGGTSTQGGGTSPQPANNPASYGIEIEKVIENKQEAVICVKLLDTSNNTYVTLSNYDLYISHSNGQITMYEGDYRSASVSSSGINTTGTVGIKSVPNVTVAGLINKIEYTLDKEVQFVNMKVFNSSDQVVYDLSESCPNPAKPLPFVWKGINMQGKKLPAGAYAVKVKAVKKDGSSEDAPLQIVTLSSAISQGTWDKVNLVGGKATYTLQSNYKEGTDTITVKMRDKGGNDVSQVAEQKVDVTFAEDSTPNIGQIKLPSKITKTINGNKITLELKDKGKEQIITDGSTGTKYHFYDGNSDFTIEKSDGTTEMPLVHWSVTDPKVVEITESEYEDQAEKAYDLLEKMAGSEGITFASNTGLPVIANLSDKTSFSVTDKADGTFSITANVPGDAIYILACDLNDWMLSTPFKDILLADNIDLDRVYTAASVPGRVSIMAISDTTKKEITEKIAVATVAYKGKEIYWKVKKISQIVPPENTSIVWPIAIDFPNKLTSNFGFRNTSIPENPNHFHAGIDFGGKDLPIYSMTDGIIYAIGDLPDGYGSNIRIRTKIDGKYYMLIYGHLNKSDNDLIFAGTIKKFAEFQIVNTGTQLGTSDNTGTSTGSHLHLEMRKSNNSQINPLKYLNYSNTPPIITNVDGPLDSNEDVIDLEGMLNSNIRFKAQVSSQEKDINKVQFRLFRSSIPIFDRTFDYHDDKTIGSSYLKADRYSYSERAFRWNIESTMLYRPINTDVPQKDEFICIWESPLEDGDYKLLIEAWDIKGLGTGTKEIGFSIENGKRSK